MEQIQSILAAQREYFLKGHTRKLEDRKKTWIVSASR